MVAGGVTVIWLIGFEEVDVWDAEPVGRTANHCRCLLMWASRHFPQEEAKRVALSEELSGRCWSLSLLSSQNVVHSCSIDRIDLSTHHGSFSRTVEMAAVIAAARRLNNAIVVKSHTGTCISRSHCALLSHSPILHCHTVISGRETRSVVCQYHWK